MHKRAASLTAVLTATTVAVLAGPAVAAQQPPLATIAAQAPAEHGDRASERNLRTVRRRIEAMIEALQHDGREYGGHRVAAIKQLQEARTELDQALRTAASH